MKARTLNVGGPKNELQAVLARWQLDRAER